MALPVTVESVASAARDVAIASLHQLLGDRLSTVAPVREQHGKDASYHPCVPLACDGEAGVRNVLEMARREFDLAMALSGCPTLSSITRDLIRPS